MPTYEYRCKSCGQHLEVVQSFTDDPLTECPGCEGDLRKVFSPIGIAFKGSGFYRNDSRATASSGNGASSDGSSKTAESTSSSSGDSSTSSSSSSTGSSSTSSSEAKTA
jgi:putative FmdB family regulatory protein